METMTDFIFLASSITADGDCRHEIKRHLLFGRKAMTNLDSILKSRGFTLLTKIQTIKAMVFPVVMYGYESWTIKDWAPKSWCFWSEVLEKTLESPLDCKEIKPVNPKGNQSRIFIGRTDAEAETSILWPPDAKNLLIGKDPDAGKDWRQENQTTEDRMVGWHQWLKKMDMSLSKLWDMVQDREAWCATVHGITKSWTQLSEWATTNQKFRYLTNGKKNKDDDDDEENEEMSFSPMISF